MLFSLTKMSCFRAKAPLVFHWFSYNKAQFIAKCDRQLLHIASHGLLKITTGTVNRLKELCHEIYENSNSENWGKKAFTLSLNSTRLIWTVSIPRPLPSPPLPTPPASLSVLTGFSLHYKACWIYYKLRQVSRTVM